MSAKKITIGEEQAVVGRIVLHDDVDNIKYTCLARAVIVRHEGEGLVFEPYLIHPPGYIASRVLASEGKTVLDYASLVCVLKEEAQEHDALIYTNYFNLQYTVWQALSEGLLYHPDTRSEDLKPISVQLAGMAFSKPSPLSLLDKYNNK